MGFYHPATLVRTRSDAVFGSPASDAQHSDWGVHGGGGRHGPAGPVLRLGAARRSGAAISCRPGQADAPRAPCAGTCPRCGCDDPSMLENWSGPAIGFCNVCAREAPGGGLRGRTGRAAGRPGAAFSLDRRSGGRGPARAGGTGDAGRDPARSTRRVSRREALWQRWSGAVRPAGELFEAGGTKKSEEGSEDGPQADSLCPLPP